MKIMDLEEYLASQGVLYAMSGYCLDKLRCNRQLRTVQGRKRYEKECEEVEREYQEKRTKAISEYNEMVKRGEVRPLTVKERCIKKANGHPDNASTQAARRMCEKRGFDWKQ